MGGSWLGGKKKTKLFPYKEKKFPRREAWSTMFITYFCFYYYFFFGSSYGGFARVTNLIFYVNAFGLGMEVVG